MAEQDYLKMFLEEKTKGIEEDIQKCISEKTAEFGQRLDEKLKEVDEMLERLNRVQGVQVVELENDGVPTNELAHDKIKTVIKVIASSKRAKANIMLVGGCGGGKSYMCQQIAKLMKIPFYNLGIGAQTTKSDLVGFKTATGGYSTTPVRQAFENGGLLCLDEIDAGNSNVLTIMNNIISSDEIEFPDGRVKKHKDFWLIATANTYGKGATMDYVGRNRLDAATLDRFTMINIDYDLELEKTITHCDKWMHVIEQLRENIDRYDLKVIVSPRASQKGADMYEAGIPVPDIIEMQILKGASEDVRMKLMEGINWED